MPLLVTDHSLPVVPCQMFGLAGQMLSKFYRPWSAVSRWIQLGSSLQNYNKGLSWFLRETSCYVVPAPSTLLSCLPNWDMYGETILGCFYLWIRAGFTL